MKKDYQPCKNTGTTFFSEEIIKKGCDKLSDLRSGNSYGLMKGLEHIFISRKGKIKVRMLWKFLGQSIINVCSLMIYWLKMKIIIVSDKLSCSLESR